MASFDYDVVIVGSGFGGSVAAFRAAEKGYRVGVMEAGDAGETKTFPRPSGICKTEIECKEDARKRGQSSPDRAEALVMAFCNIVRASRRSTSVTA